MVLQEFSLFCIMQHYFMNELIQVTPLFSWDGKFDEIEYSPRRRNIPFTTKALAANLFSALVNARVIISDFLNCDGYVYSFRYPNFEFGSEEWKQFKRFVKYTSEVNCEYAIHLEYPTPIFPTVELAKEHFDKSARLHLDYLILS